MSPSTPPSSQQSSQSTSLKSGLQTDHQNASLPVFNPEPLEKLLALCRNAQGTDAIRQIISLFLTTAPDVIGRVRKAFASGDFADLPRGFHRLKGSASHIGGARLERFCEHLESKYKELFVPPSAGELESDLRVVEREFQALRQDLERFSAALGGASSVSPQPGGQQPAAAGGAKAPAQSVSP